MMITYTITKLTLTTQLSELYIGFVPYLKKLKQFLMEIHLRTTECCLPYGITHRHKRTHPALTPWAAPERGQLPAPLCPCPCSLVAPGKMLVVLKCPEVTIHLSRCDDNNLRIIGLIMETFSTLRCQNVWNFAQGSKFKADFYSKNERL